MIDKVTGTFTTAGVSFSASVMATLANVTVVLQCITAILGAVSMGYGLYLMYKKSKAGN